MNVGDKVLYEGQVATIVDEVRPKCRCKGQGHYEIRLEEGNFRKKVPLTTIFEPFKPLNMAHQQIAPHTLL
jgi:hypothetical protein